MDSPSPLDSLDPNVPSKQPYGAKQAMERPISRASIAFDHTRSEAPVSNATTDISETPTHVARPSLSGMPSFQRPRKRVIWRDKACFIALPLENDLGRKTNRESYLRPEDIKNRLELWKSQGYDTKGFILTEKSPTSPAIVSEGQSRAIYPDPENEHNERGGGSHRVSIPDWREWEAYVSRLKEEKLRALGVSFGEEETLMKSPAPFLMSRQTSSQNSSLQDVQNPAPHVGKPGISHFPRYSSAMPLAEHLLTLRSQSQQPSQSGFPGTRSPHDFITSPPSSQIHSQVVNANLRSLGRAVSPALRIVSQNTTQDSDHRSRYQMGGQKARPSIHNMQVQDNNQQMPHPNSLSASEAAHYLDHLPQSAPCGDNLETINSNPKNHCQDLAAGLNGGLDEIASYSASTEKWDTKQRGLAVFQNHDQPTGKKTVEEANERVSPDMKPNAVGLDNNPNAPGTLEPQSDPLGIPQQGHLSKTSISKLNANAPEFKFKPRRSSDPNVFAFLGDQPLPLPLPTGAHQTFAGSSHALGFNDAAPTFTPGIPRDFSFSAAGPPFRPDAPIFKPGRWGNVRADTESSRTISGEIKRFEAKKKGKHPNAIPILRPGSSSHLKDEGDAHGEDESGRIIQAIGRQKRVRREIDDGDQVALFASPNQTPWIGLDDLAPYFSRTTSPESKEGDVSTLEAATDLLEEIIDDMSATEASDLMQEDITMDIDGKPSGAHNFHDLEDAAIFNTARPPGSLIRGIESIDPTPGEVYRATQDFLGKSPQFRDQFNRALERRVSGHTPPSSLSDIDGHQARDSDGWREREDRIDRIDHANQGAQANANIMKGVRYVEPSYDELDTIMKHLNQDNSDLGIERQDSPWRRRRSSINRMRSPAPGIHESASTRQLLPASSTRSHAPSFSPNCSQGTFKYLPPTDPESATPSLAELVASKARYSPSYKATPPIHKLNSPGSTPPSEWNDALSSVDEDKFQSRIGFFDNRVNELVDKIIQQRLDPFQQAITSIQHSLEDLCSRSESRALANSDNVGHSDADDEGDEEELSKSKPKSLPKDRKFDQLKASLDEITAAQQNFAPASQLGELISAVADLKASLKEHTPAAAVTSDIKNIVEEAVGRQMRGRSAPVTSSSQAAAAEKSQLHIAGLESMLKIAEARAEDERKARMSAENNLAEIERVLRISQGEAAQQREAVEATERSLQEYYEERQGMTKSIAMLEGSRESLQKIASELSNKNAALEELSNGKTALLAEFRLSMEDARHENKELRMAVESLNTDMEGSFQARQALRAKVDRLQEDIVKERGNWAQVRDCSKEEEHNERLSLLGVKIEDEVQTRERLELAVERLGAQEKEESGFSRDTLREAADTKEVALQGQYQRIFEEMKEQHERTVNNALEDKQRSETYFNNRLGLAAEKIVHFQDRIGHLEEKLEIAKSAAYAAVSRLFELFFPHLPAHFRRSCCCMTSVCNSLSG